MNRYLAKLASLAEKRAYPNNPQNPQNYPKRGFEGFEGSVSSAFLGSATPPTEIPEALEGIQEPADDALAAIGGEARRDRLEERAAILEFDEGLPRAEAEAIANREAATGQRDASPYAPALRALCAKCPAYVPEDRWHQAIADATAFISKWGADARTFGWAEHELFGLHPAPERPVANYSRLSRVDDLGLVWLLRGRPVIVLTSTEAIMRCLSGATLTYRKQSKPAPATKIVTPAAAKIANTEIATPIVAEIAKAAAGTCAECDKGRAA
jgi:hypothetical protein